MPWCESCDKWRAPTALLHDGRCPRCGDTVDHGAVAVEAQEAAALTRAEAKIPWHFWVMVAAAGTYLGWRVVQGLIALF